MTKPNDGGPAFPVPMIPVGNTGGFTTVRHEGLSLRDHFAGLAMQAMVSSYRTCDRGDEDGSGMDLYTPGRDLLIDPNGQTGENEGANEVAADAYAIADAMLAAREAGAS